MKSEKEQQEVKLPPVNSEGSAQAGGEAQQLGLQIQIEIEIHTHTDTNTDTNTGTNTDEKQIKVKIQIHSAVGTGQATELKTRQSETARMFLQSTIMFELDISY